MGSHQRVPPERKHQAVCILTPISPRSSLALHAVMRRWMWRLLGPPRSLPDLTTRRRRETLRESERRRSERLGERAFLGPNGVSARADHNVRAPGGTEQAWRSAGVHDRSVAPSPTTCSFRFLLPMTHSPAHTNHHAHRPGRQRVHGTRQDILWGIAREGAPTNDLQLPT
jgi:hypothetical protein